MSYPLPTLNAMGASDMAAWHGLDTEDGNLRTYGRRPHARAA
jgi:hypothetical protein